MSAIAVDIGETPDERMRTERHRNARANDWSRKMRDCSAARSASPTGRRQR
jgi:hypothetical protein